MKAGNQQGRLSYGITKLTKLTEFWRGSFDRINMIYRIGEAEGRTENLELRRGVGGLDGGGGC